MDIPIIDHLIGLYRLYLDRPRLNIKAALGVSFTYLGKSPPKLIVTVVNKGRRPIKLNASGLRLSNGYNYFQNPDYGEPGLPVKLNETDDYTKYYDIDKLRKELKKNGEKCENRIRLV